MGAILMLCSLPAVLLQKQLNRAADIMAYMMETANYAKTFKWGAYDQNLQQHMADKQDLVWAKTDPVKSCMILILLRTYMLYFNIG